MKQPYHECQQYEACSVNQCPLDPDMLNKDVLSDDPTCKSRKTSRKAIALNYPGLPLKGLTPKEAARQARRDARTPERVAELQARGRAMFEKYLKKQ